MGNENSYSSCIEIKENAVEIFEFWSQHSGTFLQTHCKTHITVFRGESFISGQLWTACTPLEKCSKNLMIYRHPSILKYISSWEKNSKYFLAVEDVVPLFHVTSSMTDLQICIGLHSILKALCFLHEKAGVSHNNVAQPSIFVTKDGIWKLGGMEYLCKYGELTKEFLEKSKSSRYNKAINKNESVYINDHHLSKELVDVHAFCQLSTELLAGRTDESIVSLSDFYGTCELVLESSDGTTIPSFATLSNDAFFNHDFICIYSFLNELPLKSDDEKTSFFFNLSENLRRFDDVMVGKHLSILLLSRLVLLNKTSQERLLPHLFNFKQEENSIFREDVFKKYITPKLIEIFAVRDSQIRLILLTYFFDYITTFSKDQLQYSILPELLLGVKDTNDILVAATLNALAALVPILGANVVIGGKRGKLFTDGRPLAHSLQQSKRGTSPNKKTNSKIEMAGSPLTILLPERQRPDGEEGETSTEEMEQSVDEEWDEWEHETISRHQGVVQKDLAIDISETAEVGTSSSVNSDSKDRKHLLETQRESVDDVINKLDIKNQMNKTESEDIDFFHDMEPDIKISEKFLIAEETPSDKIKLKLLAHEEQIGDGWGEEEWS